MSSSLHAEALPRTCRSSGRHLLVLWSPAPPPEDSLIPRRASWTRVPQYEGALFKGEREGRRRREEEAAVAAARVRSVLGLGIQGGMKDASSTQSSLAIIYALN